MSVRVMSWVWEHSASTGSDRLVLLAIADAANDQGRDAYPSAATLARKTRMDKRTVQRSIQALVHLGEIKVHQNAGPHGTNRYQVCIPRGWQHAAPTGTPPPADDRPPRQDTTGNTPPPTANGRGRHTTTGQMPRGAASDPSGGGNLPPEPSFNHPTTSNVGQPSGSRNAPGSELRRIVKAYADAARAARNPAPIEAQRDIENSARSLLEQGFQPHLVEAAARNAGTGGWRDLTRQVQIDNRPPPGTRPTNGTRSGRVAENLAVVEQLRAHEAQQPKAITP